MIIRSKPSFKDILFSINGSIIPRIIYHLIAVAILSIVAVLAAKEYPGIFEQISAIPFTLIGIALSVFMSFRNNACYDRWWEGRKLWGELIIACRSLARQTSKLEQQDKEFIYRRLCAFTAGLSAHTRKTPVDIAIKPWLDDIQMDPESPNLTNDILDQIGAHLLELTETGKIGAIHYSVLETQLTRLSQVHAGCDRIMQTPVPFAYSLLLHRTALIFCVTLPFALAGSLAWWTLLPVLLVAYTFFGLEALGHQLEDPFGNDPNALPLDTMRRTVERELLFALGEKPLPPRIEPVGYVLK